MALLKLSNFFNLFLSRYVQAASAGVVRRSVHRVLCARSAISGEVRLEEFRTTRFRALRISRGGALLAGS